MPRVRPLAREDPLRIQVRAEIHGILGTLKINQGQLAAKAGIGERTLNRRIGKKGNIGELKLDEYIQIKKAAKAMGYEETKD